MLSKNQTNDFFQKGLAAHQKGDWVLAESYYKKIIQIDPKHSDALHLMGVISSGQGHNKKAVEYIKKAIQISPNRIYFNSLGVIYLRQGHIKDALLNLNKALEYDNAYAEAYNNLGQAQLTIGDVFDAMTNFQKVLALNSNVPQLVSNYLMCLNYVPIVSARDMYCAHFKYNTLFKSCKTFKNRIQETCNKKFLRIGYVSSDFCQNSIAYFIEPVLKNHNLHAFDIYCYSDVNQPDAITQRLKNYASEWVDTVQMTNDQMAEKIFYDRVDILVDLSGHFSGNRLPVFAQQPAKVQITYLGYPNTTGLSTIQYRLTDDISDPESHDPFYSEQLIRMPEGFLCYLPQEKSPEVSRLPAEKNDYVTLGSFNNLAKVNEMVISVWSEILCNLPEVKLLLKARPLSSDETQEYIINKFVAHGVHPDQIKCMGFLDSIESHLEIYHQVDLALDPFPYNGTTTTCDALWMGVPVITRCGEYHAGRVGASILSHIGLNDFIANSTENYIAKTIHVCRNISLLKNVRKNLRHMFQSSPLMDAKRFTQKIEQTYLQLWKQQGIRSQ
ncbi:MAG: tetratricopeptide repeat protein [Candidatus Magnetomorum sp.]|nr:tetratricopeptide repeat protein [Candidatus Magnetomorum sp.]